MKIGKHSELIMASWPDKEHLVVELLHKGLLWGIITEEDEQPILELYPAPEGTHWEIPLADVLAVLEHTQKRLSASENPDSPQLALLTE